MEISIKGKVAGRLTFDLYSKECPKACENFTCLCTGERGLSAISGKPLHYKGSRIHRVYPDFVIQGGDFIRGDGRGGESIFGGAGFLPDEDLTTHKHTGPGMLAMANVSGVPNSSTSQFFISISQEPLTHLDGKYVVFGKVKSGWEVLKQISSFSGNQDFGIPDFRDYEAGVPTADIIISDCGVLERTVNPIIRAPNISSVSLAAKPQLPQGLQDFLNEKIKHIEANRADFMMELNANDETKE